MQGMKRTIRGVAVAAALGAAPHTAQISDNVIKIGVLTDMSSLYTDLAGAGSVLAARMAVEDFGIEKRGIKVEILFADHQNKPDVGSNVARQWYDVDRSTSSSTCRTRPSRSPSTRSRATRTRCSWSPAPASSDLTGKACSPNTMHWTYDTWTLANGTGSAMVKTGGNTWFFLTADYAFGHALERDTDGGGQKNGGKVLGQRAASRSTPQDFSLVPAAGAGVEGQDHRPRQRRRRYDQLHQAGRRVRHREGRAEPRRPARVPDRRRTRSACRSRRG